MKSKIIAMGLMLALLVPVAAGVMAITPYPHVEPVSPEIGNISQITEMYMGRAENAHMFGLISYKGDGEYGGNFVNFFFDAPTATVYNYTLLGDKEVVVFSSVIIEPADENAIPELHGALFTYETESSKLMIHNNAVGLMTVQKQGVDETVSVLYTLADGFTATEIMESNALLISGNDETALLIYGNNTVSLEGKNITCTLTEGALVFRATPLQTPDAAEPRFKDSVEDGKVLGEMYVSGNGDDRAEDIISYEQGSEIRVTKMEQKRLEIRVNAESAEGKIFRVCVDKESMGLDTASKVQVRFDAEVAEKAGSMDELVNAVNAQEKAAKCYVSENGEQMNIYVYVPHFSEHTITVEETSSTESTGTTGTTLDMMTIGIAAIAAVALIAVVMLIKRR